MVSFTAIVFVLGLIFVLYKSIRLLRNVQIAKSTGLPYTISPFLEFEIFTLITTPVLRYFCAEYLEKGNGWPKWARFMIQRWQYEDKYRAHEEFGDVFLVVSPYGLICYTADAAMAMDICTRRNQFTKPRDRYKMVEIYGPNVLSSEGDLYRFHVKVTAPPFRESNNNLLVWKETVRQTKFLVRAWSGSSTINLKNDVHSLALNVIAAAGFGKQLDWKISDAQIPLGHTMSFQESSTNVADHFGLIALLPKWLLRNSPWKRTALAFTEFENYMRELIMTEKENFSRVVSDDGRTKGNLLTAMLKASSEMADSDSKNKEEKQRHFLDSEVLGNAFMFLFAGHETIATTMVYGALMLALHSDLQDRMIEEVDCNFREAAKQGRQELDYDIDYPKFQYTLAFMYEILRMFPAVKTLNKIILQEQYITHQSSHSSPITQQSQQYHLLPANCRVCLNFTGMHYNPRSWKHAHTFDPKRWLSEAPNLWDPAHDIDANPQLLPDVQRMPAHAKGSFMAFSEGTRACLGRKFAQVEFVAFFVTLLRAHRLALGPAEVPERVERVLRLKSAATFMLSVPGNIELLLPPRKSAA